MEAPPIYTATEPPPRGLTAGVVLVDKPKGLTSFDVIRRLRRALGVRKMGHAGTLDPMATGLLIVLVGREATRLQDTFMGFPKVYSGTIRLGQTTASFDAEAPVEEQRPVEHLTDAAVAEAVAPFRGPIQQLPPMYSAVKVGGERLYKKARRGEEIEREPRNVTIDRFDVRPMRGEGQPYRDVDFEVACSKGTYIRTLAHDLGQALGVGGHLVALRREAIGPFAVREACALDALTEAEAS